MPALKRTHEESSSGPKTKKPKTSKQDAESSRPPPASAPEEVDFPRGGGTSLTALEVKTLRDEAVKEANEELFESTPTDDQKSKKRKRKSMNTDGAQSAKADKPDHIRIEHLNYKVALPCCQRETPLIGLLQRINVGMKILAQVTSIQPLALIVSLSNQLFGHIPITHVTSQLTSLLEGMSDPPADSDDEEEDETSPSPVPELWEMFKPGQFVRCIVTAVHAAGTGANDVSGLGRSRDEVVRSSRRVELSLVPERVNAGVQKADLKPGFTLSAAIKSVEDHGYILDLGVSDVSGFMSFKDAPGGPDKPKLRVGQLADATVLKLSANERTCTVSTDASKFSSSALTEVTSASSLLPGTLAQTLITSVHPNGLNLQVLGFFDGTVEQSHMNPDPSGKTYKIGKKIKARVLYDYSVSPPKFALSLKEHILKLKGRTVIKEGTSDTVELFEAYPVGTIIKSAKVLRLEQERGLFLEVTPGVEGFAHISHISDEHVPSISPSGPYKPDTVHRARVTGYFAFDGLLQLSLKPSVLAQKFFHVAEVEVGEVIKGTVKKLTDNGLFVSLSGKFDGVVWPNHYADIALKHPGKRFKPGAGIKCRVLVVDPERNRISLTAKKTLVESTLPILTKFEDVKVGMVCHAVVFKVFEKHLMIEFYNNLKAAVPLREVSETKLQSLTNSYPAGKVIKVRIISVDSASSRITASIRQATSAFDAKVVDISAVEIGNTVEGTIVEVHKENVVLTLQPTKVRALLSLKNLANHRSTTVTALRSVLKAGDKLEELVVVTRSPEKGLVIVANKPKAKPTLNQKNQVSLDSVAIGQVVMGRVTGHSRNGALFKLGPHLGGILHPTDAVDDFEQGFSHPAVETILKAAVVDIDRTKKQLTLSTRQSRINPDEAKTVVDPEITSFSDLKVGNTVRGFVKTIADHGLFVTIGRNVDARVQIRELFDEYVKDWQPRFKANQVVKGRIMSVNPESKRVELTFRSGDLNKASSSLSVADLQVGQKVDGLVKKIEDYGLFIQIESSKLSGLCHKSELSDNKDADVTVALRGFREGDRVKAVILDIKKGRISLGLKPSYFSAEELDAEVAGDDDNGSEASEVQEFGVVDEDAVMESGSDGEENMGPPDDNDSESEDDEMQVDVDPQAAVFNSSTFNPSSSLQTLQSSIPSLNLQGGFQWIGDGSADNEADDDLSSDDSDVEEQSKKKKKRKKQIELDLTADMHTKTPESNADFERLLLGSPNSSYLWIQYMSFQLQLSEIEKAREIAHRALRTINFREEQEKLNVWIALLNLENVYGTDESLESTFKDAARHNDSKTIHLRLAAILDQSEKFQKAEEQFKKTGKKFGQSSKVWTLFGEFYFRRDEAEHARSLLPRSLQSLEKRKHLKTISKFAQMEYKLGDPERGKTIFEGIIDSHPKRWDMWSIYMDMEAGQGDMQSLRNLFDRVLSIKMTSHKAKSFFKKWLELERRIGDEEGAEAVKAKAVAWTQKASSSE
ncbi:hypothetical protein HGRIS_008139 [Hohenbuehelia grisea]|uniref:S1 motif domain-containing protein n=1 Tax=Hohenbuehelia grisea TaxID=104357 RepID=A0ABR3J7H2_9AGAR